MSSPGNFSPAEQAFMARALELAERALYSSPPNPRVGCVLVKDGQIVGEGWHEKPGGAHAEVLAIAAAGERARGATAFVTLEPCNHFGRTPPCVDAVIKAGIARVVAATPDPNPIARGGADRLRAAGVSVDFGLLADRVRELNVGFYARIARGRPWVRMKVAASLDGQTALDNGVSQWITGPEARRDGHHFRARACAVLTGIGTVKDDDPQLNVRDVPTDRQPPRVLIDSRLEVPLGARILQGGNVLIAAATEDPVRVDALQAKGAEVVVFPNAHGKVELPDLFAELARRGWNEIHVEAGTKLNGSLLREGLIDELVIYFAPSLLGEAGRGMFNLPVFTSLQERVALEIRDVRMIGTDLRVIARVAGRSAGD